MSISSIFKKQSLRSLSIYDSQCSPSTKCPPLTLSGQLHCCWLPPARGFLLTVSASNLELEIPLWLWLGGAALTVLLSFAVVIDFLPAKFQSRDYPEADVSSVIPLRFLLATKTLWTARVIVLAMLCLTMIAGLLGDQQADNNLAPTMIWIIFWVGVTFSVTVFGDFWRLLNPFATIYLLLFRRQQIADFTGKRCAGLVGDRAVSRVYVRRASVAE